MKEEYQQTKISPNGKASENLYVFAKFDKQKYLRSF